MYCTQPLLVGGEGNQSPIQVDIGRPQAKLLRLPHAGQDRQPNPAVIGLPHCLTQPRLFLDRQEACFSCSHRGEFDAGKGAFLNHPSPNRPSEYMPDKLQVMEDSLRGFPRRSKVFHRLVKQGMSHGVQSLPCQAAGPPLSIVLLNGDGRGLLAAGGERGEVARNHDRGRLFPAVLIPFRKEPPSLLFLLGLLVEISRCRLGRKTPEPPFLPFVVEPYMPHCLAGRILLTEQSPIFAPCSCHRSPSFPAHRLSNAARKEEIASHYDELQRCVITHAFRGAIARAKDIAEVLITEKSSKPPNDPFHTKLEDIFAQLKAGKPPLSWLTFTLCQKLRLIYKRTHPENTLEEGRPVSPELALSVVQDLIEILKDLGHVKETSPTGST